MQDSFKNRRFTIQGFFILVALVLIFKCFQIQVINQKYKMKAQATAVADMTIFPSRGLIYDRNDNLLVNNEPIYDLKVTYERVRKDIDTAKFCKLLGIDIETYEENLNKDWRDVRYAKQTPFVFMKKISAETYARFQESMYEFPGFFVEIRNVRSYPYNSGAHVLGYLSEVNPYHIENGNGVYRRGDYIGISGIEKQYEAQLRGIKGRKSIQKDKFGRSLGSFMEGIRDTSAVSGNDLVTTLDVNLQLYGELLMGNKRGAIVAIEPSTGEILSMLSTPTYDPNLLSINRDRGKAFSQLLNDTTYHTFQDRALLSKYPPGSVFKTVVALIAMQEGLLDKNRGISCNYGYHYKSLTVGCHGHVYAKDVTTALQHSCNAYFCTVFRDIVDRYGFEKPEQGLDEMVQHLHDFGLGDPLGVDLPGEAKGNVPTSEYYKRLYRKDNGKWRSPYIVSMGIGQGEVEVSPLQMANLAAIIANKGSYTTPHLAKGYYEEGSNELVPLDYERHKVRIDSVHFAPVIDGMELAVKAGTATRAYVPALSICGKTGTSQNSGTDHSVFFAFAPKENPKIAIAVYIENAGFGGKYAAPIASLMIEQYLTDSIANNRKYLEKMMLDSDLKDKK